MNDLISRQAALDAISTFGNREYRRKQGTLQDAYKLISALPSANKSGHWTEENAKYHTAICSECGKVTMFETWGYAVRKYDFCPNCGCDMRGEKDD